MLAHYPGRRLDRHRRDHGHDQCLRNSKVKPPPGRAHGTFTVLMPHLSQRIARHAGMQIGLVLKEAGGGAKSSARCHRPGSPPYRRSGRRSGCPGRSRSRRLSSRCASGSKSLRLTAHGWASPNACCSKEVRHAWLVSALARPSPGELAHSRAAVNDAARRKRWPAAIIVTAAARAAPW